MIGDCKYNVLFYCRKGGDGSTMKCLGCVYNDKPVDGDNKCIGRSLIYSFHLKR